MNPHPQETFGSRLTFRRNTRSWLGLAGSLLAVAAATSAMAASARPPNIVYIMADDLGYGDIGPFGQKKIRTPSLDRLAAEGTCFDQFYPGAAVCSPSRCVLMTGLHTGHARIRGNHGTAGLQRVPLRAEDVTVAEVLKSAGYATAIAGKWGLGEPGNEGIPNRQGFDHWFGYLNNDLAEFYFPEKIWKNEQEITLPGNVGGKRGQYSNDLMTEEALGFIEANRARPFFVYLAYTIPHSRLEVPADSLAEYAGKFPEVARDGAKRKPDTAMPRATFAAMVTRLDREVGRVMGKLRALGLDEQTIVFFCSDNGAPERGGDALYFGSTGPSRGFKGSLWEGGIRGPMIVRWPGRVRAGARSTFPWAGWDFLPTAAALAGVAPPANVDGISVLPALLGGNQAREGHLYWEIVQNKFSQALRLGDLKAVRLDPASPIEVYDLRVDPGEKRNVAASHAEFVTRAEALFRTSRTDSEHWPLKRAKK
ncbi:MAG: arylsulfatase [Opitutaceae bacterium]|nr:arylsulfatase [Opitutaceae bacterium]